MKTSEDLRAREELTQLVRERDAAITRSVEAWLQAHALDLKIKLKLDDYADLTR